MARPVMYTALTVLPWLQESASPLNEQGAVTVFAMRSGSLLL